MTTITNTPPPIDKLSNPEPNQQVQQPSTANPPDTPRSSLPKFKFKINLDTRSLGLILIMLSFLLMGQLFIFRTFNQRLKEQQGLLQQVQSQSQNQAQISQQLSEYQAQIQAVNNAFPDETGLSEFVQIIDRHLSLFEEAKLQFDTNQSLVIKEENIPFLPLTISATTTVDSFTQFLTYLSNSPYLFMPQKLQLTVMQTIDQPVTFILKGRLYVNQSLKE